MASDDKQKLQLRPHAQFAVGSDVEVSSDEEGFRDIWFPAKVVSPPSKFNKSKYLVEYKSLFTDENGSELLTELVDPRLVRPELPAEEGDQAKPFEVNDVVEAYNLDGWWVGVVIRVLGGGRHKVLFSTPPDEVEFERSSLRVHKDWVDGKWVRPQNQGLRGESASPSRKRGTSKANVGNSEEMHLLVGGTETIRKYTRKRRSGCGSIVVALKPDRKKLRMTAEALSPTQEYEDSPKDKADSHLVCNNEPDAISETDKPLSSQLIDSRSPPMVDLSQGEEETHAPPKTPVLNDVDTGHTFENATNMLPFAKTSPAWRVVESMEAFRQIPQNPHFQPLFETKQDRREGLAIGYMVTFSGLIEKISKLHFSDPKNIFDDSLETLSDLEQLGFNVDPVRARLKELISIKGLHENSQMKIDEKKKQLEEQHGEKMIIDEEINKIDKLISKLSMKRELAVSRAEKLECVIEELESEMESVKRGIEADQAQFEKVVIAPW